MGYGLIYDDAIMNRSETKKLGISTSVEGDIFINGEKVHLKYIFSGQIKLDSAMMKIFLRRLAEQKKIS